MDDELLQITLQNDWNVHPKSVYNGARLIHTANAQKNHANYPSLFYVK